VDGVGVRMRMRRPRHLHLSFFSAVGKITRSSLRCERDSTPRDRMNGDAAKSGLSIGNEGGEPAFPHPACATNGRLNKCVLESETGPMCPSRIESHWTSTFRFVILSYSDSGAGRNLKVGGGGTSPSRNAGKIFSCPSTFCPTSTISSFGKRFRDCRYSLVSFLPAVFATHVAPVPIRL